VLLLLLLLLPLLPQVLADPVGAVGGAE